MVKYTCNLYLLHRTVIHISMAPLIWIISLLVGCEYGDRVKGCNQAHCLLVDKDPLVRSDCCGTCNIGETITTTTPVPYTLEPKYPGVSVTYAPNDCLDKAHVNEKSCYDFIMTNGPHVCYDDILERYCCRTCSKLKEEIYQGKLCYIIQL